MTNDQLAAVKFVQGTIRDVRATCAAAASFCAQSETLDEHDTLTLANILRTACFALDEAADSCKGLRQDPATVRGVHELGTN